MSENRMWGGRFSEAPDSLLLRVNASIGFDRRLLAQDILGSIAHARMLGRIGILSSDQAERLRGAAVLAFKPIFQSRELALKMGAACRIFGRHFLCCLHG